VVLAGLNQTKERLTVVIDKGMNADGNYAWIDEHAADSFHYHLLHLFLLSELAATPLERFEPVTLRPTVASSSRTKGRMPAAYRTTAEYWAKPRAVIVTYNRLRRAKQAYTLMTQLEAIRQELL